MSRLSQANQEAYEDPSSEHFKNDAWLAEQKKAFDKRLRLSWATLGPRAQALAKEEALDLEDAASLVKKAPPPPPKKDEGSNLEVLATLLPLAMEAFAGNTDPFTTGPPAPRPGAGAGALSPEETADITAYMRRLREAMDANSRRRRAPPRVVKRQVIRSGFAGLSEAEKERLFDLLETIPSR